MLERVFDPVVYAKRLDRLASMLDRSGRPKELSEGDLRHKFTSIERAHRIVTQIPGAREPFWKTLTSCAKTNPGALRYIVMLMAIYLHLGPYSRYVIAAVERRIAAIDAEPIVPAVAAE